jgi:hypothetical protein
MRDLFQSGAVQRPAEGSRGPGGGAGSQARSVPAWRNVYILVTNTPAGGGSGDPVPKAQSLRVRTGITDGSYTEITEGLKEGDRVIISAKVPQSQVPPPTAGASPFGGPPRFR